MIVLDSDQWQAMSTAHLSRATALTDAHLKRRQAHIKHPVFDFLFEYYPIRAAQLKTWHPGAGVGLAGTPPHADWRFYKLVDDSSITTVDTSSFLEKRGTAVEYILTLLNSIVINPTQFDCFGLHEWAMVYRTQQIRHDLPLRLSHEATNTVVETHQLKCTHFDAFRFFTAPATTLNLRVLRREDQPINDQSGCLHATMDLYKWCAKLGPLVPGELFLDAFELARDARILDMEASPYDCTEFGFGVVPIETSSGKAEYVNRQRELSQRAKPIRDRLVSSMELAFEDRISI